MTRPDQARQTIRRLRWQIALAWAALAAERAVRAFWPMWSVVAASLGLALLGLPARLPPFWADLFGPVVAAGVIGTGLMGILRMSWPTRHEAMARLDRATPGRPLEALLDSQAIGADDPASRAVWNAHLARAAARAAAARPGPPDLRLSRHDPLGLRYVALLILMLGAVFGEGVRLGGPWGAGGGARGTALAAGPAWEGWVEPPPHTGRPTLYLNDIRDSLTAPEGSRVTLRLYGPPGRLAVSETVSAAPEGGEPGGEAVVSGGAAEGAPVPEVVPQAHVLTLAHSGRLSVDGPGGRSWQVEVIPDAPPAVELLGPPRTEADGRMVQDYAARDDYGVVGGQVEITLDMARLERRHGLAAAPEPRPPIVVDLPIPVRGSRKDYSDAVIEDFSRHPWAHLPVVMRVKVVDARGQEGQATATVTALPARTFFDPLAAAVVEMRRDLLWSRANGRRVARILRAISWRGEEIFPDAGKYLGFRFILHRLERGLEGGLAEAERDEIAEAMWQLAIDLEEGDVADALARLRRARERLAEAIRNGASDEEIERLMQELREATSQYLRQLSRQAEAQQSPDGQQGDRNSLQLTMDDLQRMMDRIEDLMKQGRTAEAEQALRQLQQLMENMRVTQGGPGGQGQSPGEQAMDELGRTLREQQGLSDQAFRELQEQFNPGARAGRSEGNAGRNGGQGRGQAHEGQGGSGRGEGEGREAGRGNGAPRKGGAGQGQGGSEQRTDPGAMADRQRALRRDLQRQRGALPLVEGEEGRMLRRELERAEGAMEGAEQALRQGDLPRALDRQAEAIEALREGMRNLGQALAGRSNGQGGPEGQMEGEAGRDPLGRVPGATGRIGTGEELLQGEDVYRRARELLDEIRRRSGEGQRPAEELDYLRRLLERF